MLSVLALAALLAAGAVHARSSDRHQPMDIEAGYQEGSMDGNGVTLLTDGVVIRQGSLDVRADRAEITLAGGDPVRAVLTGSPTVLKQQMDDGTPMTARAARVDYDLRTEIVTFTGNVEITQPRGTMSGQRVVYNLQSGRVESGGQGAGRVKMRILPRGARTPDGGAP